jgi:hypothetical protein
MIGLRGHILLLSLLTGAVLLTGCRREEPPPVVSPADKPGLHVVVPEEVKRQWKAVRIVVHDRQAGRDLVYTVDIGGRFDLPETGLQVEVLNLLPTFVTDGKAATSIDNALKNPGVEIVLRQGGRKVGHNWLFKVPPQDKPEQHQLSHPRYSFRLAEVIARR